MYDGRGGAPFRNARELSVISEEKSPRSGQSSFEKSERVAAGLSPDGLSPDGLSPPFDYLRARGKESAASVTSSGMDRTQSPSEGPHLTPTRPGKPPVRKFISTPKNESDCPDFRLPFVNLSSIGVGNATLNSTTGSNMSIGTMDRKIKVLGPKATTDEVLAALEKMRMDLNEKEAKRNVQLRSIRTPVHPPKEVTPSSGKEDRKEQSVVTSSKPKASPLATSLPLQTPTPLTSSASRTFPFGDSNLGIGNKVLAFGCLENKTSTFRAFPMKNLSDKPLRMLLSLRNKTSDFKIMDGYVRTLQPGEEQTVRVEFFPSKTVFYKNTLFLENTSDKRRYTVGLGGYGGLARLSIPLTTNLRDNRYGIHFLSNRDKDFIRFSVESTGNRSLFCKVILKANDETLSVPIKHERFVLKSGENKNIEINISGLNVPGNEYTVVLLWDAEVLRQRMAAYLKQSGRTPNDPLITSFAEQFLGAEPYIDEFPINKTDLMTFELAVNRTIIIVTPEKLWDLSETLAPSMASTWEQTLVKDDQDTMMTIRK